MSDNKNDDSGGKQQLSEIVSGELDRLGSGGPWMW